MEQLVQELFADVDRLREDLERKADEVEEGRRRLAERGRQLADQRKEGGRLSQQLEQQETRLSEALTELKSLRQQLDEQRQQHSDREAAQAAALQQRLEQLEADRDGWRRQVEALQQYQPGSGGAPESLAPVIHELSELRRNLLETRTDLAGAIDRASAAQPEPQVISASTPEAAQRIAELERERTQLEAELEIVRARAAELQQATEQMRRELSENKEDLGEELRLLRQMVEQQGEFLTASRDETPSPDKVSLPRIATPADDASADPVVNNVMAQFARLQRDVAQRRKKK